MKKIVLLCREGEGSYIVYNSLSENFHIEKVIIEGGVPKKEFLKRRLKREGLFAVLGQLAFSGLIVPILRKTSADRKREILNEYKASTSSVAMLASKPIYVKSVNDEDCINALREIQPDIVVVNGTRIISSEVLECVDAKFINMHAGITPKYRGCHGAYWALYNQDRENAGVTVHVVDKGIDTGAIIYQSVIPISAKDNFTTYPILQTCLGVRDEVCAINDIIADNVVYKKNDLPTGLYTHPTIFQYFWKRITRKVK